MNIVEKFRKNQIVKFDLFLMVKYSIKDLSKYCEKKKKSAINKYQQPSKWLIFSSEVIFYW